MAGNGFVSYGSVNNSFNAHPSDEEFVGLADENVPLIDLDQSGTQEESEASVPDEQCSENEQIGDEAETESSDLAEHYASLLSGNI